MKKLFAILLCIPLIGCNIKPFSPELKQDIKNNGTIDEIKNNQDGVMAEIGKLNEKLDVQNSTLRDIQEGVVNLKLGGNDNSGFQFMSGDGGLMLIFGLGTIGMLLFYFYKERKVNKILADEIKKRDDPELHSEIIKAAAHTSVEKNIYNLLYKD